MIIRENVQKVSIPINIFKKYKMDSIAYFDIETTGFKKEEDKIILISLGWYLDQENLNIKQYYAENLEDERELLKAFGKDIEEFITWCSYNGLAFDEPFIKFRFQKNKLEYGVPSEHIDLYRLIRPYYKQLGIDRCNLKTVEKFIGIQRKDTIDGGLSVELYNKYLQTSSNELKEKIMLHNYEDVLNLPKIFNLIYRVDNNEEIIREDAITEKQIRYLNFLMKKNNIKIDKEFKKISKKAASRIIDGILKGALDNEKLENIIKNSY
ncbi:ribonuclease H-like domain-containing protein [Clostridium lundense]|uniref:ribonuclease H-like domain-containing protein n=1 Tax=Clostridium lundense TaxID=319475 RepID=UPI00048580B7|nr:ribonuclease H-like domain-containing protein [Clostridium lundense]